MTLIARIQNDVANYVKFRRTAAALRALPLEVALDLDLYSGDAEKIARRVVYGA
jgi:hypothetical protein